MTEFKEGDRVAIRADRIDGFRQPWRSRFAKGRAGTIKRVEATRGVLVEWDNSAGLRHQYDWRLWHRQHELDPA